ncbi:MAG: fibronectin type III domain-containing protein [Nitrosotalea sp.]
MSIYYNYCTIITHRTHSYPFSSSQNNLFWTAPSNNGVSPITGYQITVSTNDSTFTALDNIGNATTYSTGGLHPHTTYYFKVSAISSVGTSQSSNTAISTTR